MKSVNGGGAVDKWKDRDKKLTKRRTMKEQQRFFRESQANKNTSNKLVMKEKQREQDKQNEDDGETDT